MKKLLTILLCVAGLSAAAKIKLPTLVGDNMVLQRSTQANLWGWADAGKTVTVTTGWDNKTYTAKAAQDGSWKIAVATPGAGGPYNITVSDGQPVKIANVMIGEVWICSGQSNMALEVSGKPAMPVEHSLETILESGKYRDKIRIALVPAQIAEEKREDCPGAFWSVSSPATVGPCSAAAYFFARTVTEALGVPVGILVTARGGSRIEAWIDKNAADEVPGLGAEAAKARSGSQPLGSLYNGQIWPVKNYTARGFLWYQGEANRPYYAEYAQTMAAMVRLWRKDWENEKMPFYYVQIPPYNYGNSNDMLRGYMNEAQYNALALIPESGMAGTADLGDEQALHPPKKQEVGVRLALLALDKTYGLEGFPSSGPVFKSVKFDKGVAQVQFEVTRLGLDPSFNGVKGFELAGADKVFYPARANVVGSRGVVNVACEEVPEPVAVRYAFRNYCEADLKDTFGLPAFPFRSDDWDYVTEKTQGNRNR